MKKTKKSISKRFKVTKLGKLLRRKAGKNHFMRRRTRKQKKALNQDQSTSKGFTARYKQGLPFA